MPLWALWIRRRPQRSSLAPPGAGQPWCSASSTKTSFAAESAWSINPRQSASLLVSACNLRPGFDSPGVPRATVTVDGMTFSLDCCCRRCLPTSCRCTCTVPATSRWDLRNSS